MVSPLVQHVILNLSVGVGLFGLYAVVRFFVGRRKK